jgi:hypothetical protein
MFEELELVVLTHDIASSGLLAGDVGTIFGSYGNGGYEVEFATADGHSLGVETLGEKDIRPRAGREILHVRSVD